MLAFVYILFQWKYYIIIDNNFNKYYPMSIYSGFATRLQQKKYNQCLQSILKLLTNRLIHFFHHDQYSDSFFKSSLSHIYQTMQHLQLNKYLAPYYSKYVKKLLKEVTNVTKNHRIQKDTFHYDESKLYQRPMRHFIKINNTAQIQNHHERTQKHNIFEDIQESRHLPRKISFDFKRNNRAQSQDKFHFESFPHNKHKIHPQISNIEEIPQVQNHFQKRKEFDLPFKKIEGNNTIQVHHQHKENKTKQKRRDRSKQIQRDDEIRSPRQFLKNVVLKSEPAIPLGARVRHKHQKIVDF